MRPLYIAPCLLILSAPTLSNAESPWPTESWRFDVGLTLSRFEQQVKSEIGGARGERLVEESRLGAVTYATWHAWGPLSVGGFLQYDAGTRRAGRFEGLDENNMTVVEGEVGGGFSELWLGPVVRGQWKQLYLELGYGLLGRRTDDARGDLPNTAGNVDDALETSPTVAWMFGLGAHVPITETLDVALRVNYRIRYYDQRGGKPLVDELVHGTQDITPFIGLSWRVDDDVN
ncbi:MAG: hypothetical protein ACE366_13935 [Bradymonadia bacterium]